MSGDGNTLLTYALVTNPSPLQVSPSAGDASVATLTVVVSCPKSVGSATVSQIMIVLPVGKPDAPDPTDLTESAPPLSAASISSSGSDTWTPGAGAAPNAFVFTPHGGPVTVSGQSLTIEITGIEVSPLVGTAIIRINEWAAQRNGTPPAAQSPPSGTVSQQVAKFPYGFYAVNFTAGVPEIAIGQTATLSWIGSTNASFLIKYAGQSIDVSSVRTWTSPPLYEDTAFLLEASSSQGGQTVSLDLEATVMVATPTIVSFSCVPNQIDYNEPVTLEWIAADADGVYLTTGQVDRKTMPPMSDAAHPTRIVPEYGKSYTLQAFKAGSPEVVSVGAPLQFTFNPMTLDFSVTPTTLDLQHQTATVAWSVAHGKSVTLNGQPVGPSGSRQEHPTDNTAYELAATWVDGSVTTRRVPVNLMKAALQSANASFEDRSARSIATLIFHVANATGVTITGTRFLVRTQEKEAPLADARVEQSVTADNPNQYRLVAQVQSTTLLELRLFRAKFKFSFELGISIDYTVNGFIPVSGRNMTFWQP